MSKLDFYKKRKHNAEARSVTVVPSELWRKLELPSMTGVTVTAENALTFSAVFAAHKILSESVAMLPLFLLKRMARGKTHAREHPLYRLLHDAPNPEMDAYLFRETLTAHLVGWGKAFAKVDYDANGQIAALWVIPPSSVLVTRSAAGALAFEVTFADGQKKMYRQDEMLYLRGMSPDGIDAYSPIRLAREGIGLALAAESFGGTFFGNGAVPQGVIMHPGELGGQRFEMSQNAYDRLLNSWSNRHGGISNANKIAILEEGMKYEKIGIPPEDAQFLQTRKFQIEEIARWYRIPSMMLNMDGASSTYASVEAFGLQFINYTLYPWLVRWEKAISQQLLLPRERETYFAEHSMSAILRGDVSSRYQAYATARQWGWMSVNDIREFENMNPIQDGDVYLTPLNMIDTQDMPDEDTMPDAPEDDPVSPDDPSARFLPIFVDAMQRIVKREKQDITSAGAKILKKQGADEYEKWLSAFYEEHREFVIKALTPAAMALTGRNDVRESLESVADWYLMVQRDGASVVDQWDDARCALLAEQVIDDLSESGADTAPLRGE